MQCAREETAFGIAEDGVDVIAAQTVCGGEVGVLVADRRGWVELPNALIFGCDKGVVVAVSAEGSDKRALVAGVPGKRGSSERRGR